MAVKHLWILIIGLFYLIGFAAPATARLQVVTTTEDLASLTHEVGGDKVEVNAIAKGYQDPHFVDPKPIYLIKLHKADLLIAVGLDMEAGWLPSLVQQSRNSSLFGQGDGYLDASVGCMILERLTGQVTRAMGDEHPLGNPHYWLDPLNGRIIAVRIAAKLSALDPSSSDYFQSRLTDFNQRLQTALQRWDKRMTPYRGVKIVTYHNSWPNFVQRYGFQVVGYVEPKPGIPPSPSHTLDLIQQVKAQVIKIILVEPYFELRIPQKVARDSGTQVVLLMPSVGGNKQVEDYFSLLDYNLATLEQAFRDTGVTPPAEGQ